MSEGAFYWGHRLQPLTKTRSRALVKTDAWVDLGVDNNSIVSKTAKEVPVRPAIASTPLYNLKFAEAGTKFDLVAGVFKCKVDKFAQPTARLQLVTGTSDKVQVNVELQHCSGIVDTAFAALDDMRDNLNPSVFAMKNLQVTMNKGVRSYVSTPATYMLLLGKQREGMLLNPAERVSEQLLAALVPQTVLGTFTLAKAKSAPNAFSCENGNCRSTEYLKIPTSETSPLGARCVYCDTVANYSFTDRLVGVIHADIGLDVAAIVQGGLVKQILLDIAQVNILYMNDVDDVTLDAAEILAKVAHHATFVLRGNKVLDIIEDTIDLTYDDCVTDTPAAVNDGRKASQSTGDTNTTASIPADTIVLAIDVKDGGQASQSTGDTATTAIIPADTIAA